MTFIQELAEKSLDNEYFKELIEKTEKRQAHLFFKTDNPDPKLNNKALVYPFCRLVFKVWECGNAKYSL